MDMRKTMKKTDQTVFVTGADRGIGRATVIRALKEGYSVVAASWKPITERAEFLEEKLPDAKLSFVDFDVRDAKAVTEKIGDVLKTFGRIDILVNVAGISYFGNALNCTEEEWDKTLATNVKGYFLLAQAVLSDMCERKDGKIINLSSIWGQRGSANMMAYSVSKFAIEGFTKSLQEFARPSSVRVTSIVLDKVDTDFREYMEGKVFFTPEQCKLMLSVNDVTDAIFSVIDSSATCHISTVTLEAYLFK
jgi:3-oxoacyl-[acyl-carrier protein] reductase